MINTYKLVQVSSARFVRIEFIKSIFKVTDGESIIQLNDDLVIRSDLCLHEIIKNYNAVIDNSND